MNEELKDQPFSVRKTLRHQAHFSSSLWGNLKKGSVKTKSINYKLHTKKIVSVAFNSIISPIPMVLSAVAAEMNQYSPFLQEGHSNDPPRCKVWRRNRTFGSNPNQKFDLGREIPLPRPQKADKQGEQNYPHETGTPREPWCISQG